MRRRMKESNMDELFKVCQQAWDALWADLQQRQRDGHDFRGNTYYLTAADIETKVREFITDDLRGDERGTNKSYGWSDVRVTGLGPAGLKGAVRDWLHLQFTRGKFDRHNFGRGHISGMRYRPKGSPLSDAERKTLEKKERPKPRHVNDGAGALCTRERRKRNKRPYYGRRSRSNTRYAYKLDEVTCERCKKCLDELSDEDKENITSVKRLLERTNDVS